MAKAVAVILCLAVLAGCGSTAPPQFQAGYAAARRPLNQILSDVNGALKGVRGRSTVRVAGTVGALAGRFRKALAPLEALKPPARIATAFTTLTSSLRRVENDLREISIAARRRNLVGASLAVESLSSDARAASQAAAVIKQKLYAR